MTLLLQTNTCRNFFTKNDEPYANMIQYVIRDKEADHRFEMV